VPNFVHRSPALYIGVQPKIYSGCYVCYAASMVLGEYDKLRILIRCIKPTLPDLGFPAETVPTARQSERVGRAAPYLNCEHPSDALITSRVPI
jgi:hypothetical protein